jgi:hypothetical protein
VKRKAPEEGHRTLEFQICEDGKCIAQKKAMKERAILLKFGKAKVAWRAITFTCRA